VFQNVACGVVLVRKLSKEAVVSATIGDQTVVVAAAAEAVERLSDDVLQSLAALAGAPDGVAELAFNTFPSGTQM
jgi:hypothetical protein